jgi:hypothetical protein
MAFIAIFPLPTFYVNNKKKVGHFSFDAEHVCKTSVKYAIAQENI